MVFDSIYGRLRSGISDRELGCTITVCCPAVNEEVFPGSWILSLSCFNFLVYQLYMTIGIPGQAVQKLPTVHMPTVAR